MDSNRIRAIVWLFWAEKIEIDAEIAISALELAISRAKIAISASILPVHNPEPIHKKARRRADLIVFPFVIAIRTVGGGVRAAVGGAPSRTGVPLS